MSFRARSVARPRDLGPRAQTRTRQTLVAGTALAVVLLGVAALQAGAGAARAAHGPSGPQAQSAGDTLRARPGDRLVVRAYRGRVQIRGVDGDLVRTGSAESSRPAGVRLSRTGDALHLTGAGRRGRARLGDVTVEVPRWLPLDVRGQELEATVEGLAADVALRNVDGDLRVRNVEGAVTLWSVEGDLYMDDVIGPVSARSVDGSVGVQRVVGDVEVGSTDGDLRLLDVDSPRLDAQTVDGDVRFEGPLRPAGTYTLVTHDGEVVARIPEDAGARVEVSTFDGRFESEFPITVERFRSGGEAAFTLGDGSARLVLQAFDGDIRLERR